tara:strand:- start:45 stop:623 length:579 start_codon:yes stop_codon:yes gene_type:complete
MASTTIVLVSPARVQRDTALGGSVDPNVLFPAILNAQEKWILPVVGTDLFDKIKTLISADEIDNVGNEKYATLLNTYIIPCLVQFSFMEVIPVLRVRFVNNAVVAMNTEQGGSVSYDDIKPLISTARDIASWYKERLIDYLCANSTLYPEYTSNSFPDVQPSSTNYTQGLNVERTYRDEDQALLNMILGPRR